MVLTAAAYAGLCGGKRDIVLDFDPPLLLSSQWCDETAAATSAREAPVSRRSFTHLHTYTRTHDRAILAEPLPVAMSIHTRPFFRPPDNDYNIWGTTIRATRFLSLTPPCFPFFMIAPSLGVMKFFKKHQLGGWDHVAVSMAKDEPLEM